ARNWTDKQKAAIDIREKNLLLSAAAGSGKTAVLTERAVELMMDKNSPVDADRLLIVTFTRAAAQEMKQRIQDNLSKRIAAEPDNKALREQKRKLSRATIGTIDSLCIELLKENGHILDMPAAFRIGDTQELSAIRNSAVDEVLEKAYSGGFDDIEREGLNKLRGLLSSSRSDKPLAQAIIKILDFAMAHPHYTEWLDEKAKIYSDFDSPEKSEWGKILIEYASDAVDELIAANDAMLSAISLDSEIDCYNKTFSADGELYDSLKNALKLGWDSAFELVCGYKFPAIARAGKNVSEAKKESCKALRDRNKKAFEQIRDNILFCGAKEFENDAKYLDIITKTLFSLVKKTDFVIMEKKRERGVFDFSDLSQAVVRLLSEKGENGFIPTETAKKLQQRFGVVMVDEFQDVNEVQDTIVRCLSNGSNLFMVGDVKQSIYRFRQARPEIFLARSEEYSQGKADSELITLDDNFRSRKEITEPINNIFAPLFSKKIGELVYDNSHSLKAKAPYPPVDEPMVEFRLYEQGELNSEDSAAAQARETARQIKEMLDSHQQVFENGEYRDIRAGDVAILLRSAKAHAEIYRAALEEAGIDAFAALESGFLDTNEISAVINLLKAIQNPTRDIELIGALLSPIFGFTADDTAKIRIAYPNGGFYLALLNMAGEEATDKALSDKVKGFLSLFGELRRMSATADAMQVISAIYEKTGFDLRCRAMKNGRQRFGNLMLLTQYAQQYHENGYRGVSGFLRMIDNVIEQGDDLAPAFVGEQVNAVAITSIHKSKGLEWPVVFLCETARKHSFLSHDNKAATILDSELGFASVIRNEKNYTQAVTAPLAALRLKSEAASLSEELRVLYVAMTRAKERLIMTAAMKNAMDAADIGKSRSPLSPMTVRRGKSYAEWIIAALGCYGNVADAIERGGVLGGVKLFGGSLQQQADQAVDEQQETVEAAYRAQINEEMLIELRERLGYDYPYQQLTTIPAKLSVSQITHESGGEYLFAQKPSFASKSAAGNERGSAVHAFMQYCDYSAARENAQKEVARLVDDGVLTERQGELVDVKVVDKFFASDLAARMFAADELLREYAFMASAAKCPSAKQYSFGDEAAMLQGIADCIIIEGGSAVLVDYKTDHVKTADELIKRYHRQLELYTEILDGLVPPIKERIIWSFSLGCEIKL
ncbi:MAG: helicase-exonuclease AddAB subunit AddA, partial [Oscillospiraceae bacterium]|nr:helicase-exonuclease AddAB subunit AddA [Oscillospiraceae bacterium]